MHRRLLKIKVSTSNMSGEEKESSVVRGIVVRSTGSWYDVYVEGRVIPSRVRGKFRLQGKRVTNPVAVGDWVHVRVQPDGTGLILEIEPRRNKISRKAGGRRGEVEHVLVANVDFAWCVQSVKFPVFMNGFVDRFLVVTEANAIPSGIIINKIDLIDSPKEAETVAYWKRLYEDIGYQVLLTSAQTGEGIDALKQWLKGRVSVVAGPSGVGKSSLLNAVEPSLQLKTGAVSEKLRRGRHTTTYAALYPLSFGGFVADTPGIQEFGLWGIQPRELSDYFVEMRPLRAFCRFPDCLHDQEPGCAVKEAVEHGQIYRERYASYLQILHELQEAQRKRY